MKEVIARDTTCCGPRRFVSVAVMGLITFAFCIPRQVAMSDEKTTLVGDVARQLEAANNALAGLEKALEGLPGRLLTAKVAERKPKIEPIGPDCVNASWTVVVSYNYTNYTKQLLPPLRKVLSELATGKSSSDIYTSVLESEKAPASGVLRLTKSKVWGPGYFKWPQLSWDKETEFPLLLHVGRGEGTTRLACYILNQRYAPLFDRLAETKPRLKIELLDAQKQVLRDEDIDLSQYRYVVDFPAVYSQTSVRPKFSAELDLASFPSFLTKRPLKDGSHQFFVLEPQVRIGATDRFSGFTGDAIAFLWKTKLSLNQAKMLTEIQCHFTDATDLPRRPIGTSALTSTADSPRRAPQDSVQPLRQQKTDVASADAPQVGNSQAEKSIIQPSSEHGQPATTDVIANGVGIDSDKALRDALRNAVQQAVGAVVDTETLVRNENVIKDQILTYSDGYVEHFDTVRDVKREDGLCEIRIKATIKRRQLIEKLKTSKVISTKLDGQSLFGELVTQLDAAHNAAQLLNKALDGLPLNLLVAGVADQKPQIISTTDQSVQACWNMFIAYDYQAYKNTVLPRLQKTLGDIAKQQGSSLILSHRKIHQYDRPYGLASGQNARMREQTIEALRWLTFTSRSPFWRGFDNADDSMTQSSTYALADIDRLSWDKNTEGLLLVHVDRSNDEGAERFAYYVLDKGCMDIVKRLNKAEPRVRVEMVDEQQKPILLNDINLNETEYGFVRRRLHYYIGTAHEDKTTDKVVHVRSSGVCHFVTSYDAREKAFVVISPMMKFNRQADGEFSGNPLEFQWTKVLNLEDIKRIRAIRCRVVDQSKAAR